MLLNVTPQQNWFHQCWWLMGQIGCEAFLEYLHLYLMLIKCLASSWSRVDIPLVYTQILYNIMWLYWIYYVYYVQIYKHRFSLNFVLLYFFPVFTVLPELGSEKGGPWHFLLKESTECTQNILFCFPFFLFYNYILH